MTAQPGLALEALQLHPYGNSGRQRVKTKTHQTKQKLARVERSGVDYGIHFECIQYRTCCSDTTVDIVPTSASEQCLRILITQL